jgi:GNAT superfamily N-acetyltransferase
VPCPAGRVRRRASTRAHSIAALPENSSRCDEEIAGGVIAALYWDWLYVDLMWIRDDLRNRGYGRRLLTLTEEEARRRGAKHAYLDTFSFQAPGFYERLGYRIFGTLQDFPAGHQRYYMTKEL